MRPYFPEGLWCPIFSKNFNVYLRIFDIYRNVLKVETKIDITYQYSKVKNFLTFRYQRVEPKILNSTKLILLRIRDTTVKKYIN